MYNDDLKRFYKMYGDTNNKNDFVRYDDDGSLGVQTSDINSGNAAAGQIMMSDGDGSVLWHPIDESVIDSGEAPAGSVLVATGTGGTTWGGMAAGISFTDPDDDGNIVISEVNS
jgi:hypothetical protein